MSDDPQTPEGGVPSAETKYPDAGNRIRITLDDLNNVATPEVSSQGYGTVGESPLPEVAADPSKGSIFLKSWCYLGLAGLGGSLVAWAICEPRFRDAGRPTWANVILIPLMVVLSCVGFGVAESIAERSPRKAAIRGAMALAIGTVLGFFFDFVANIIFTIGLSVLFQAGSVVDQHNAGLWFIRSIAWVVFGISGGVVYGLVGQSGKRCLFGIAGGMLGAGLGGLCFDPIAIFTGGAALSRAVGLGLFGLATGVAIGLVESALKDRWIYVAGGPLAGKQFILYKQLTTIGSDQSCDIYLFKDPSIQPRHAVIELRGSRVLVHASGPVAVQGRPISSGTRMDYLESGNSMQIGRYQFVYRDRERSRR